MNAASLSDRIASKRLSGTKAKNNVSCTVAYVAMAWAGWTKSSEAPTAAAVEFHAERFKT